MKLLKKHKDILQELIKGKGYFKTPTTPYSKALFNLYQNLVSGESGRP